MLALTLLTAGVNEDFIKSYFLQQAQFNQQTETKNRLSLVRTRIEDVINSNIFLVQGFASVVATKLDPSYFAQIVREITKNSTIIRNIAGAPGLVISLMNPVKGNEAVIGLDYSTHPKQLDAVNKVI